MDTISDLKLIWTVGGQNEVGDDSLIYEITPITNHRSKPSFSKKKHSHVLSVALILCASSGTSRKAKSKRLPVEEILP